MPRRGASACLQVLLEEISSRSEFADGETAARPLRVVYADHSRLEHHGVAAVGAAALLGRLELVYEAR